MDGKKINPRSRELNQGQIFEPDGGIMRDRPPENAVLIFFQRVGRAFSDFGGLISRAFSNLAGSFRGAFAHVSDMTRGVDRDTALRNVTVSPRDYSTRYFDLDEEESDDENFDVKIDKVPAQSLVEDESTKKTDFSEMISSVVSRTPTEQISSVEAGTEASVRNIPLVNQGDSRSGIETSAHEIVEPKKTNGEILDAVGFALVAPLLPKSPVKHDAMVREEGIIVERPIPQISTGEKLFRQFFQLYAKDEFDELNSLGSPFFQSEALEFARKITEENNRIKKTFTTPPSEKEVEAAAYLRARKTVLEGRAEEDTRRQEERAKAEQIQKEKASLTPGEWDFEEFLDDFRTHEKKLQKFMLFPNLKYRTNPDLLAFAEKVESDASETEYRKRAAGYLIRWNKNPEYAEKFTNDAVGFALVPPLPPPPRRQPAAASPGVQSVPPQPGIDVDIATDRFVSPSPPPSLPSTPRWISTLSSILGSMTDSRDEMPGVYATVLMPNHGMEDRNLAWQGLHSLLSPLGKNSSSAVASDNEVALSYQHNSALANEESLRRLELARQMIAALKNLNIDDAFKGFNVIRPDDNQIKAIRKLKSDVSMLSKELEERINVLSPAKSTVVTLPPKIPALESLSPRALNSANADFNAFVKEFASLSEQQRQQYQFDGVRSKYSRPNCSAIAQSVIASYKGLDPKYMIKEDQDRLTAAEFMIGEFDKKNSST